MAMGIIARRTLRIGMAWIMRILSRVMGSFTRLPIVAVTTMSCIGRAGEVMSHLGRRGEVGMVEVEGGIRIETRSRPDSRGVGHRRIEVVGRRRTMAGEEEEVAEAEAVVHHLVGEGVGARLAEGEEEVVDAENLSSRQHPNNRP